MLKDLHAVLHQEDWTVDEICEALHYCISQGLPGEYKNLLDYSMDVSNWNITVSHLLLDNSIKNCNGNAKFLQMILENGLSRGFIGCNSKAEDHGICSAMQCAIGLSYMECVQVLLQGIADGDVNTTFSNHQTPLMMAASSGKTKSIDALIQWGADINDSSHFVSALMLSIQNGHLETMKYLIKYGADVNLKSVSSSNALSLAVAENKRDFVRLLLESGADVNIQGRFGNTPLIEAATYGYTCIIKYLIQHNANVQDTNMHEQNAIGMALRQSHHDAVMTLLKLGAASSLNDCEQVIKRGWDDILKVMLTNDPSLYTITSEGKNILHKASFHNSPKCLSLILELYQDTNCRDGGGHTPLFLSCFTSSGASTQVMEILISKGANLNIFDNGYMSLLSYLIRSYFEFPDLLSLIRCALHNGCDVNISTVFAKSYQPNLVLLLEGALRARAHGIARMLFEAGSDRGQVARWRKGAESFPWYTPHQFPLARNKTKVDKTETLLIVKYLIIQPRPLSKIARMVIRKQLGQDVKRQIDLLPIPIVMKTFLSLPELNDLNQ